MKHEARVMQGQRSGTIINISSTYGPRGRGRGPDLCRQQARRRRHHQVGGA
jgi:hypothetical protein